MKVRIEAYGTGNGWRFGVERKRWYGWQPIYKADILSYCESYIADLSKVREVEWVKKMMLSYVKEELQSR